MSGNRHFVRVLRVNSPFRVALILSNQTCRTDARINLVAVFARGAALEVEKIFVAPSGQTS